LKDLKRHATYIVDKINVRCLFSPEKSQDADTVLASFLDTAAAVEITLARGEKLPAEKRRRLCDAHNFAQRAITLQAGTLPPVATGAEQKTSRLTSLKDWRDQLDNYDVFAHWMTYKRRLEEVEGQPAYAEC
jgi:hypothetical protein